jgi:8-oxo-dGTP diphosphatase
VRVLRDKAKVEIYFLEQLMIFSGGDRDPRGWLASAAYYALTAIENIPTDVSSLTVTPLIGVRGMPFDHDEILVNAMRRWRRRAAYSSLPAFLLTPIFTLPALRLAFEKMLGRSLNVVKRR